MKSIARVLALVLAMTAQSACAADALTMSDFAYRHKLMVAGYTGTETLANFPVLVRVSESGIPGFHFADMSAKNVNGKALGYDLAFFAEDGTRLEVDQDTWDIDKTVGTTGEQLVWVKLPTMTQGTKFFMCHNVADGVYVTNDKPWGGYVGVWHMSEASGTVADATGNGLGAVPNGTTANSVAVDGKLGKARQNAVSGADGNLTVPSYSSVYNGTAFTISGWFYQVDYNSNDSRLFSRKSNYSIAGGWETFAKTVNNTPKTGGKFGVRGSTSAKDKTVQSKANIDLKSMGWTHLTFVYNGTTATMYTNGVTVVAENSNPIATPTDNSLALGIGNYNDGTGNASFFGYIDECRLLKSTASADWVKAEYDTVNNASFVTLAPKDPPVVTWTGAEGTTPGVTSVGVDTVVVSGTVQNCDDFDTCEIQCKVWPTAEGEPENWTTITNGLVASDAFSVIVPGMAALTTYGYKLRAVGDDGETASAVVSGMFTTQTGFSVAWSDVVPGAEGLSTVGYDSVTVSGTVAALGGATACEIQFKVWEDGGSAPAGWTTITNGLVASDAFSVVIPGLSSSTTYNYSLRAVGNDAPPSETTPVTSTFTTAAGLTITAAVSNVSYVSAMLSGSVTALGGATACDVEYKVWASEGAEPSWTTLAANLEENDNFAVTISDLAAGTAYSYKVRAVGDNGDATDVVSGTFTTPGDSGEVIGSPDTHFFDDGTNSYWVANEFERYLDFTVTGYTGTETLTNFPVLVDVRKKDTNGFTYDDFYHMGGRDIVFVDEKGHVIPHEIDTWNPNGMSLIWVRLPEMNNGTKFTMCYRSPLVNPPADPGNAFEKYVGVWHMNEEGNGIVDVIDSTTNNLVGETHANSLADSNGRIGGARRVAQQSGTSSTYGNIIVPDHDDILRTGVGNVFTYSCWSKLADSKPGWAYLVSRKTEDASNGWGVQYHDGNSSSQLRAYGGSSVKNEYELFNVSGYSHTKWAYWTFVFSNQTFSAYLNGNRQSTVTLKHPVANDETAAYDNLIIGGQEVGTGALNGWVDECRYSKGIRSADWIKAEYDSTLQVNTPFVTKGTQVGRGDETLVPVVVWEQGADLPVTVIDVSYAYVQFAGTVTYCGSGADTCWIEYQLWADGAEVPTEWTTLLADAVPGTVFSIPVFGLKQDMPYNFRIRAVNEVDGERRQTREHTGSFRTNGNVNESAADGELMRVDNRFVYRFRAGEYTFTTPDYVTNIEIIVVGGGGAGGYKIGGGGGGGGVFYSESYAVTTSTTYRITVGRGGTAPTNTTTPSSAGNGEYSSFALDSDASHPLIEVPGGGGGGSCSTTANYAKGSDGASGGGAGGRGDTSTTGMSGGVATLVDGIAYGHKGGDGNKKQNSGSEGAYAAGGGGGGHSAGLAASSDKYYGGGAGGSGVACDVLGEMLYFGAGGGGGYAFFEDASGFSKPGAGGSGIGGNAADVKNGTPATSGIENTGAGGGGGSMTSKGSNNSEYWQGGDGGDGVVIISYEVHGRDPISDEPRISMTGCTYEEDEGLADISYRVYWAGVQNDLADILVHYSTVGTNELENADSGGWVQIAESAVGVGNAVFTPPEVGYTYWVRLVARKHASSYAYSDEIFSFTVPAISLNGATWTESKTSPDADYATLSYKLYETNEVTHLYCYWSEDRAALEGDAPPSGDNVYLRDLGANTGRTLSSATSFTLAATEGLDRNKTYYFRLASGDAQGIKHFLSDEIVELDTAEKPVTVLSAASWADSNVATVEFKATVGKLDPAQTELVVLYGLVESHVKDTKPETNDTVTVVGLGFCSDLGLDVESPSSTFPLWSSVATNYYVRLALATNVVVEAEGVVTTNLAIIGGSYSQATRMIAVSAVEPRTLLYIVTANPKVMCYGDEPLPLDYGLKYAGQMEGWGWENRYALVGAIACDVSSTSASGIYPITQGTLLLENGGPEQLHIDDDGVERTYQHKLTCSGATYTITNAVFTTAIEDVVTNYTGEAFDASGLVRTLSGIRNEQPVTYLYRANGAGDWGEMPAFTNVGNHLVQFVASAPNHDDVRSSFKVTVVPAPLTATIEGVTVNYTGAAITPAVVTNVTGLVRGDINPLTCEFRDEAGEWQREVPSFILPGTYKIYFRASAPNHATAVTNCTVVVNGWDFKVNMDGMTGYGTPIIMGKPEWIVNNNLSGMTGVELSDNDTRYGALDAICANGLRLWQNYILERTDFSKKVVATIMQQGSVVNPNSFVVHFPNIEPLMGTGLRVQYRLDKKLRRNLTKDEFAATSFEIGELTGKYETNIPLGPDDPTGLYVFNIVFSPTNELYTGQSVIASCATIGVLRVSSALTNTMTITPWSSMSVDTTNEIDVSISDVVNPNSGLSVGDMVLAYNATTSNFNAWVRSQTKGDEWNALATVTAAGKSVPAAETNRFALGKVFWLVRNAPTDYIYLLGRYVGEIAVFEIAEGDGENLTPTMVVNPTFWPLAINSLEWSVTPDWGDQILIPTEDATPTVLTWNGTNWGASALEQYEKNGRMRTRVIRKTDFTIPPGRGFWYYRKATGALSVTFPATF